MAIYNFYFHCVCDYVITSSDKKVTQKVLCSVSIVVHLMINEYQSVTSSKIYVCTRKKSITLINESSME